ncbi:MAG: hypothetical protein IPH77_11875 [Ignavibacteria bacterium]|nr:hypothetical protein [Ignavibacteria bacterium]
MAQLNRILANYLSEDNDLENIFIQRQYPKLLFPGKSQEDTSGNDIIKKEIPNTQILDSINPFNWRSTARKIANKNPDLLILRFWIPFFAPAFYTICRNAHENRLKGFIICDNVIPHEHRPGDLVLLIKLIFKQVIALLYIQRKC